MNQDRGHSEDPPKENETSLIRTLSEENQQMILNEEKKKLEKEVQEKEELLRKLKMVQLYRKKNDLNELKDLISKWKEASQLILLDLQKTLPEPKPTVTNLLKSLQIDPELIGYNEEDESFT